MKRLLVFILIIFSFSNVRSQLNFYGIISDTCKNYSSVYTFNSQALGTPSQGSKWSVYKDGILIGSGGGGSLGCCYITDVKPLTDSVLFVIESNQGFKSCLKRRANASPQWSFFEYLGGSSIYGLHFFSSHTGYAASIYEGVKIRRISDVNPRQIYEGDLDTSIREIYVLDTLYGQPDCPNLNELIYRFNKDGVNINIHISFSQIVTDIAKSIDQNDILVYPNPVINTLSIDLKFDGLMELIDLFGRTLKRNYLKYGQNSVDLSEISSGFYIIHIQSKEHNISKSIIKN